MLRSRVLAIIGKPKEFTVTGTHFFALRRLQHHDIHLKEIYGPGAFTTHLDGDGYEADFDEAVPDFAKSVRYEMSFLGFEQNEEMSPMEVTVLEGELDVVETKNFQPLFDKVDWHQFGQTYGDLRKKAGTNKVGLHCSLVEPGRKVVGVMYFIDYR